MKFKSIIFIILGLLFLASCDRNFENIEVINEIDIESDGRGELYARAGLSDLKIKMARTDPFNLKLSHTDYFYTSDIYVAVSCDIEDAEIYYTMNGKDPQRGLSTRSNRLYTGRPVLIGQGGADEPTIFKVTAFLGEESRSDVLTHTYFISSEINSRFSEHTYVVSITSDPYNLWDYDYGILTGGRLRDEWRAENPGVTPEPHEPANFNQRGRESERPAYVEIVNSQGGLIISQSIGLRVRGGWSRASSRKSLGLYARSEYDPVFDRFYYDFFPHFDYHGKTVVRGTDKPVESYGALLLRNGANDRHGAHMREELSQVLLKKSGLFIDYKEVAPAAVFVNGEYYGFYWLETFYPETYFFENYGETSKNNIDIRAHWQVPNAYGTTLDSSFEEYMQLVDIDNFMSYYAFQIYICNRDWPHNNLRIWRYAGEGGGYINPYYDGKFRFLPFDAEMGWGMYEQGYEEATIQRILRNGTSPSFSNLMNRPDMVEKFCNQMWDLLHTIFTYDSIFAEYTRLIALNDHEMRHAISRDAASTTGEQLEKERAAILTFARNRERFVRRDMSASFGFDNEVYSVSVTGKAGADITLNTIKSNGAGTLESRYFTAHSVRLRADTQQFDYWLINGAKYDTQEVILNNEMAQDGIINAELFLK